MQDRIMKMMVSMAMQYDLRTEDVSNLCAQAVVLAWKEDFGQGYDVHCTFTDKKIRLYRLLQEVLEVTDRKKQVYGTTNKTIEEELEFEHLSAGALKKANNFLKDELIKLRQHNEYEFFKDKAGQLFTAVVKKVDKYGIILRIANYLAFLPREFAMPLDRFEVGQQVKVLVYGLKRDLPPEKQMLIKKTGEMEAIVERVSPKFIIKLLEEMVGDLSSITIKAMIRVPGQITKILMEGPAAAISSCIGPGGSTIKSLKSTVGYEHIHIISYDSNPINLIKKAIGVLVEDIIVGPVVEIIVKDEFIGKAIGINGINKNSTLNLLRQAGVLSVEQDIHITTVSKKIEEQEKHWQIKIHKLMERGLTEDRAKAYLNGGVPLAEEQAILSKFQEEELEETVTEFKNKGGTEELLNCCTNLIDILPVLVHKRIFTIEKVLECQNPIGFTQRTGLPIEKCITLFNNIRSKINNL